MKNVKIEIHNYIVLIEIYDSAILKPDHLFSCLSYSNVNKTNKNPLFFIVLFGIYSKLPYMTTNTHREVYLVFCISKNSEVFLIHKFQPSILNSIGISWH